MFQSLTSRIAGTAALLALSLAALPGGAAAEPGTAPVAQSALPAATTTIEGAGTYTRGATARAAKPRIVGGSQIPITSAPWQVFVQGRDAEGYYSCGGAIIAADKVLTAAHCTLGSLENKDSDAYGLDIVAGSGDVGAPAATQQLRIAKVIRKNPEYHATPVATTADLAVLTLDQPLTFSAAVQAIALPAPWTPTTAPTPVPSELRVTGFGAHYTSGSDTILRAVTTTAVTDPDLCAAAAENAIALCTHSGLGSSCQGDSGGPITTVGPNPVLVGIVSNGPETCGATTDDFYVNLLAPENRQFVDNLPVTHAPRYTTMPTMNVPKLLQVGQSIGCTATGYSNNPTAVRIEFTKDDGTALGSVDGTSGSIVIPPAAAGQHISCRSYGTNAGGTSTGTRLSTIATVAAAPVVATPTPTPNVTPAGQCPEERSGKATEIDTYVYKKTITSRRNRYAYAKVDLDGLPATPYVLNVLTSLGQKPYGWIYKKTWDMEAGYDSVTWKIPLKVAKTAKIGRTYWFNIEIRQASSRTDLKQYRMCKYVEFYVKVRIKR